MKQNLNLSGTPMDWWMKWQEGKAKENEIEDKAISSSCSTLVISPFFAGGGTSDLSWWWSHLMAASESASSPIIQPDDTTVPSPSGQPAEMTMLHNDQTFVSMMTSASRRSRHLYESQCSCQKCFRLRWHWNDDRFTCWYRSDPYINGLATKIALIKKTALSNIFFHTKFVLGH